MPLGVFFDFWLGGCIFDAKPTFLVLLPYLLNRLEFRAHILTQGRSWADGAFKSFFDFWLGCCVFGTKNYVIGTFAISLEPLGVLCSYFNPR